MRLVFRTAALADLTTIHDVIATGNPAVANAVIRRIKASLERLVTFPRSGRVGSVPGTREVVVSGLPYIVVYELPGDDTVDIIAVFHCAQKRP